MDTDEWEILPNSGFVDLHDDGGNINFHTSSSSIPKASLIDMDYFQKFIDPPQKKSSSNSPKVIPVVSIKFDDDHDHEEKVTLVEKEVLEDDHQPTIKLPTNLGSLETTEAISQVSFKKLKENEFVDMKIDSPKSKNRGFVPQLDMGTYQFEQKEFTFEKEKDGMKEKGSNLMENITWKDLHDDHSDHNSDHDEDDNGGLNIFKWAMTGIGALVSFGVAAATVSLIVLGTGQKEKYANKSPTELHFQIFTHEKTIKEVMHHANKLNDAISSVRGAPLSRAHITIGGYYEGL